MKEGLLSTLRAIAGLDNVCTSEPILRFYSGDAWPRLLIVRQASSSPPYLPEAVVWPKDTQVVSEVLRACSDAGVAVIPYGGGSGVCGGTVPVQGGIILDLKKMNKIEEIDELSMTVRTQAGVIGSHLEAALNERGYTLGHFPSSIMCSTVGGWVATRSGGQYSSRYGKIEDMVAGLEVVWPDGTVREIDFGSPHPGMPDFGRLVVGSEGTLGVVTRVRLKIHPAPASRGFAAFRFMDVPSGLEAMRSIMQFGLRPSVMRLYDPLDTLINQFSMSKEEDQSISEAKSQATAILEKALKLLGLPTPRGPSLSSLLTGPFLRHFLSHPRLLQTLLDLTPLSSLLVIGFEGDERRVKDNLEQATELAKRATGIELGPGPGQFWHKHRYSISFKLSPIFNQGAFVDTVEVAGLWRDVPKIYQSVRDSVRGDAAVLAHFSHAYREGCAVYFTLASYRPGLEAAIEHYDRIIRKVLSAAVTYGATVSHHHGIGMMKTPFITEEYLGGERLFWAIKEALDPHYTMNPGKVYPTMVPVQRPPQKEGQKGRFNEVASWEHMTRGHRAILPEVPEEIGEILDLARRTGMVLRCQSGRRHSEGLEGTEIDLSRMDAILEMDPISGVVTAQAGITLYQLENYLREKGFTLGFIPRSRLRLSLGEYLATSSSTEGSQLYGTILENCIGLSAVLADGTVFTVKPSPRRATGPDLMHLLLGAFGRYGIITAACLRVFPLPSVREAVAFGTDDPVLAMSAIRTTLVRQARPEWVLLVVRSPSRLDHRRRVRIVYQFGGHRALVTQGLSTVRSVMESLGMESEQIRAEERPVPKTSRAKAIERYLPMRKVMDLLAELGATTSVSCPEAHVTDISTSGATFRLLLRDEVHAFPQDMMEVLGEQEIPEDLLRVANKIKASLDPEGVLNPDGLREEVQRS